MPPLPPSSSGGTTSSGSSSGASSSPSMPSSSSSGVVVDSVVVVELSVVVDEGSVVEDSRVELAVVSPPLSLPAITITAISRPTITATRPATSRRMLPWGRPPCGPWPPGPRSSGPISRVGSSCICLSLRSQDRVEDRVGVLDLETVSEALCDLLPAAAGNRHLGREQARSRSIRAPGVRLGLGIDGPRRRHRRLLARRPERRLLAAELRPRRLQGCLQALGLPPQRDRLSEQGVEQLGDLLHPPLGLSVGFGPCLRQIAARLLFGVVDDTLGGALGGLDDRLQALGGVSPQGLLLLGDVGRLAGAAHRCEKPRSDSSIRPTAKSTWSESITSGGSRRRVSGRGTLTTRPRSSRSAPTAAASMPSARPTPTMRPRPRVSATPSSASSFSRR